MWFYIRKMRKYHSFEVYFWLSWRLFVCKPVNLFVNLFHVYFFLIKCRCRVWLHSKFANDQERLLVMLHCITNNNISGIHINDFFPKITFIWADFYLVWLLFKDCTSYLAKQNSFSFDKSILFVFLAIP